MAKKRKVKPFVVTVTVGESPEKDVASLRAAFDKMAQEMVKRSRRQHERSRREHGKP